MMRGPCQGLGWILLTDPLSSEKNDRMQGSIVWPNFVAPLLINRGVKPESAFGRLSGCHARVVETRGRP